MNGFSDNIENVDLESLGLSSQSTSGQGNRGQSDFWSSDEGRGFKESLGIKPRQQQDANANSEISNDDFQAFLAFQKARNGKDVKSVLELAGIAPSDALAMIPSLSADDNVNALNREIEQLKAQLNESSSWVKEQKQTQEQQAKQAKVEGAQKRVYGLLERDEFKLVNGYNMQETVWNAGREFAQRHNRPPNQKEWLELAVSVENSLREQARSIREAQIPLDKLDLEGILGGSNQPHQQQSSNQSLNNKPTLNNNYTQQTSTRDDSDNSREARIARALEAARRIRG